MKEKLCDTCRYRNNVEQLKPCIIYRDNCEYYEREEDMKAIIQIDVPDYQIGQEVSIYFKDTMMIKGIVQEPKTGHWIEVENYSDIKHKIKCSNCEEYIFSKGHARSQYTREHYPFCSMCGAKMVEPQESEDEE